MRRAGSVLLFFIVGLLVASPPARPEEDRSIDLSGNWRMNDTLSDDPSEVMQKKMEEMRAIHGGRRGEFRGEGRGDGPDRERMRERFRRMEQGARHIVIQQTGEEVAMIHADRDTITIVPDGKWHRRETPSGDVETRARWIDFALEVKTRRSGGPEITRLHRISDEGRLEIVTFIELPRGNETVEIVSVYDDAGDD